MIDGASVCENASISISISKSNIFSLDPGQEIILEAAMYMVLLLV